MACSTGEVDCGGCGGCGVEAQYGEAGGALVGGILQKGALIHWFL